MDGIGDEPGNGLGKGAGVSRRNEDAAAVLADDAADAAEVARDRGAAMDGSLEENHAEGLVDRRPDEQVGPCIEAAQGASLRNLPMKRHARTERGEQRLHRLARRPVADNAERPVEVDAAAEAVR